MPDRPAVRLTGFALLLVAVFGVALAAGRMYGPDLSKADVRSHA